MAIANPGTRNGRGDVEDPEASPEAASQAGTEGNDHRGGSPAPAGGEGEQAAEAPADLQLTLTDDGGEPLPSQRPPSRRGGRRFGAGRKPASAAPSDKPAKPARAKAPSSSHVPNIGIGREAAAGILALATGGLSMAIGPKALMTPAEREQIEPPLGRILARMSPQAATLVATFADPLMLGVGLVVYLTRVLGDDTAAQGSPAARTAPQPIRPTQQAPRAPVAPVPDPAGMGDSDASLFAEA